MSYPIEVLKKEKYTLVLERERIASTLLAQFHSKETETATNIINSRIEKLKHSINILTNEPLKNY